MKIKTFILLGLALLISTICSSQTKPFFVASSKSMGDYNITCNVNLKYNGEENIEKYIEHLSSQNSKDRSLYDKIEDHLKDLGLKEGIKGLNINNCKFTSIPYGEEGNYGMFDNYTRLIISSKSERAFLITINSKRVYFLLSGCIFYPISPCDNCGEFDLIYDFKCKEFRYGDGNFVKNLEDIKIRYNERLRFKIINVNRYLYDVQIAFDDVVLKSNEPELFKTLFLGQGFDLKGINLLVKDAIEESIVGVDSSTTDNKSNFENLKLLDTPLAEFITSYTEFKAQYNEVLQNYLKAYSLCLPIGMRCCNEKDQITRFEKLSAALLKLQIDYNSALARLAEYKSKFEKDKGTKELELAKEKSEIKKKEIKNEIAKLTREIEENNIESQSLKDFGKILETINDEKLLELVHFENNFLAENFEYVSPTVYPKGNSLTLSVDITPNTTEAAKKWLIMPLSEGHNSIELRVKNKWFYSFSTGPFVAFHTQFKTDTYGWQKQPNSSVIDDDSRYKLIRTGRNGLPVGIAGFANLGTKVTDYFGLGVSVGVGATILDKVQMAYFVGVTGFLGQDKQFNFTTGISFVQIEKLKKDLYPGIGIQEYSTPIDLEYTKKIAAGFFVSVSYTIFESVKTSNTKTGSSKASATTTTVATASPAAASTATPATASSSTTTPSK